MFAFGVFARKSDGKDLKPLANYSIIIAVSILILLFAERYVLELSAMQADLMRGVLVLASYLFGCAFSLRAAFLVKEKRNKILFSAFSGILGVVALYLIILVIS